MYVSHKNSLNIKVDFEHTYGMATASVMKRSFLPIFCILHNQVMTPSLHVMARKYSHVMVCHMSDCMVLVDQAHDESRG